MKKSKILLVLAVFTAFCLALTGCGGDTAPNDAEQSAVPFESTELGFSTQLPAFLAEHMTSEITTIDAYGETIRTLHIYYTNEEEPVQVLSFDEMSLSAWEQMQAEGGPAGTELGRSADDRVIILNGLQSNPFAEGSDSFTLFEAWPEQSAVVTESFQFLES